MPINHPDVINKLYTEPQNIEKATSMALNFATLEQTVVQPMYDDDKLVNIMTDPLLGFVGSQFKLNGIEIDSNDYIMTNYTQHPEILQERIDFAEILIDALFDDFKKNGVESVFLEIQEKANYNLWLGNPYTSPDKTGGISGWYLGKKADSFQDKLLAGVKEFVNYEPELLKLPTINSTTNMLSGNFITDAIDKVVDYFAPYKNNPFYQDPMPSDFISLSNLIKESEAENLLESDFQSTLIDSNKISLVENAPQSEFIESDISETGSSETSFWKKIASSFKKSNVDKLDVTSEHDTLDLSSIKIDVLDNNPGFDECNSIDSLFPPLEEGTFETTLPPFSLMETPKSEENFLKKWTTKIYDNIFPKENNEDVTQEDFFALKEKNILSSQETNSDKSWWNTIEDFTTKNIFSPLENDSLKDLFMPSGLYKEVKNTDLHNNKLDFFSETSL